MCPQKIARKLLVCSFRGATVRSGEAAGKIGHRLVELERVRHGLTGAFYSLEKRTGIGHRTWRDWWYGVHCESILVGTWDTLIEAYEIECQHQVHEFLMELAAAKLLRRENGGEGATATKVDGRKKSAGR
jgi:hypothetical protein